MQKRSQASADRKQRSSERGQPSPPPFAIGAKEVEPGTRLRVDLAVTRLASHSQISLPVVVLHGTHKGPRLWLSAAIHGDEANGIEVVREVIDRVDPKKLHGTLVAVPVVNVFGFLQGSRYLPDRRDLNRSFPGSPRGSLASRLAHIVMTEVVSRCTHGIDLHTGSDERTNLPQIRGDLADRRTRRFAFAFNAPVVVHARTRDGSLRAAATERGLSVLLYEAGEARRFDEDAIATGVQGVLRVMTTIGMGSFVRKTSMEQRRAIEVVETQWVRSRAWGVLRFRSRLGARVEKGDVLGVVADAFGQGEREVKAPFDGIVIGHTRAPLVHQGDAIVNLGRPKRWPTGFDGFAPPRYRSSEAKRAP